MATPSTVLAVAVGDHAEKDLLISSNPPPRGVRRYIHGLINGLNEQKYTIGDNYIIRYWQCKASELRDLFRTDRPDPSAIFCMSTRVVDAALTQYQNAKVPIVGIISDPAAYAKNRNVCGFSAQRFQTALDGYQHFIKTVPSLSAIYVLSEKGYAPSDKALKNIEAQFPRGRQHSPIEVDVSEGKNIETELTNAHIPRTAGIFVLPIDRCFGTADDILDWAAKNSVPTFWPVTDWVSTAWPCALGGYGVSQELCGYRVAGKLAHIWSHNGAMPAQKFDVCQRELRSNGGDFSWIASLNAYKQTDIVPPRSPPADLNII